MNRRTLVSTAAKYAVAVLAVVAVTAFRLAFVSILGDRAAYVPFILAVAISAWFGGLLPGLFATALGGVAAALLLDEPIGSFDLARPGDELAMSIYLVAGVIVTALAAGLRNGRERAEAERVIAEGHAARAGRLEAVATAVGRELRPREAAEAVLREGLAALGAGSGVVGILEDDGATIRIITAYGYPQETIDRFERFPVDAQLPLSEAVRLREPIVLTGTTDIRERYPDLSENIPENGTALVLPLIYEERAIGGLYFRFRDRRDFSPDDLVYLMALGRQCSAALQRARLYETEYTARRSAQQAAERLVFLAHASDVLGSSLDYETTVATVARLAIPQFADWCSVYIREADDSIRILALEHADPAKIEVAWRYLSLETPTITDAYGAGAVIRDGHTQVIASITTEMLDSTAPDDPERRQLLRAIAPRSALIVPLIVRDRTIGAMTLTWAESARQFDEGDRALAEDLAHRAATAIDNARLFRDREATGRELRVRARQQESVARLGQQALFDENLQRLFDATVAEVSRVLDAEFATLLELDPADDELVVVSATGWTAGAGDPARIAARPGEPGHALLAADALIADETIPDAVVSTIPMLAEVHVVAHASLPIPTSGSGRPWGVLAVDSRSARRFDVDDVTFLRSVVNVLAGAIARARQIEEERRSQDVGRAFIGVVSHELRTPITSIYAGAKLLHRRAGDEAERADLAADIEAEADRLYRLTEDLLVLTRLERHDLELGREPILLNHLLRRVLASEERRWPLVTFQIKVADGLDTVMGEESYVEQVVRNLLSNAAKYSPAGTVVEVIAEPRGREVALRVLDRGPGLGASDPSQLFALFYRAPGTASQASGAGIGLFVCDQLVRAMGGQLWAKARDGGGSEFGFSLETYAEEDDPADEVAPKKLPLEAARR
ncbi:MAG: GAF domain-containing protein [Chloroflexota bacterium]